MVRWSKVGNKAFPWMTSSTFGALELVTWSLVKNASWTHGVGWLLANMLLNFTSIQVYVSKWLKGSNRILHVNGNFM